MYADLTFSSPHLCTADFSLGLKDGAFAGDLTNAQVLFLLIFHAAPLTLDFTQFKKKKKGVN